jgi:heat-inducible transcriptional repressor
MLHESVGGELSARQQVILAAIVGEFIATGLPVGSKTISEKRGQTLSAAESVCPSVLNCSSATVRNEMADLERQGYLEKPHTSAGRVPTQPAYRFYVDRLKAVREGPSRDLTWVHGELSRCGAELATLLRTSTRLLSELTGQPALASEPGPPTQTWATFRLTPISARAIRVTYETEETGRRELIWESPQPLRGEEIAALSEALEDVLCQEGVTSPEAAEIAGVAEVPEEVVGDLLQTLTETGPQRVYVEGTAHLLSYPEFMAHQRVQELMAALAQEGMARALLRATHGEGLRVLIGSEHGRTRFLDCSLVLGSYRAPATRIGSVGVLGPLRMSYPRAISAVATVAREIGQILKVEEEGEE